MDEAIVSSRVRLARNYEDLPFPARFKEGDARDCVDRTLRAMKGTDAPYAFKPMDALTPTQRQELVESHMISPDLSREDRGAALIRGDGRVSLMMNEEDHLRIQGFAPGLDLLSAAKAAFMADDLIEAQERFAFDGQLGYLTACPTNTGTGMRASVMLHLPLLTALKQMGKATQLAAKLGLTLRGIYGEGSQAQGNLYQLSNQVTLGRTEEEISEAVTAVARQMAQMEKELRKKAGERDPLMLPDQAWRALGLMKSARRMSLKEFMVHWSSLRLGAAEALIPITPARADTLLIGAQPAHLKLWARSEEEGRALDAIRADYLRCELEENNGDLRTV